MGKYSYYWDKTNKKKVYGGKHGTINGYHGNNIAGDPRSAGESNTNPVQLEFVGSGSKEYKFYKPNGILTVRAESEEEAQRIAKIMGYRRKKYKR